jgi:hypothetical protein
VTIFGPALPGGGYGEFGGFVEVTGLLPNALVSAQIIMYPCGTTGCPNDISFDFGAFDGGSPQVVQSSAAACGSALVTADGNGDLFIHVGKNGDSGAENNLGLELSAPPPMDSGAFDASPPDATAADATPLDATPADASAPDATPLDANPVDAIPLDAADGGD